MRRLLVDGIFFQLNNTGIARVWASILPLLAESGRFEIFFLDRGNAPQIDGVQYIPFPEIQPAYSADDSILIQRVCDHYAIDVFTSTYYTTPMQTPMVLMLYDMIPELYGFDLTHRFWMEKETAISFAQRYVCISHNTRNDLLTFYPEISPSHVEVAHCGVDTKVFHLQDEAPIEAFKQRFGLKRPYYLFVGSRVQHNNYKNSRLFFDAIADMNGADFDVLCVGGEREIDSSIINLVPSGVRCIRLDLSDSEMAPAYGGALALVYPSLYEGFGMPVIEAMASGCPVITTHRGSLPEAAGDAACIISGTSTEELRDALLRVREPAYRSDLRNKGLNHAHQFRWGNLADSISRQINTVVEERISGKYDRFFSEWRYLRETQASVDCEPPSS